MTSLRALTVVYKKYSLRWCKYSCAYWIDKDGIIVKQFGYQRLYQMALKEMKDYVDSLPRVKEHLPKPKVERIHESPELPEAIKEALRWKQRA